MKKTVLCILFFLSCLSFQVHAQNADSDSLLQTAKGQNGTKKLETLKKLAYSNRNISEGVRFARILFDEAQKQQHIEYQSLALGKIANHYSGQFETDSFFIAFEPFEKFCIDHKYYKHYFIVSNGYVNMKVQRGNYSQALKKANEVYDLAKTENNDEAIGMSLQNISMVYESMNQYPEAISYLNKALSVLKPLPMPNFHLTDAYSHLASIYSSSKQHEEVIVCVDSMMAAIDKMHAIDPNINMDQERLIANSLYASAYFEMGTLDKALFHLNKAETLLSENGLEHLRYIIDQVARNYYRETGNYPKALEYNERYLDFLLGNNMSTDWDEAMKLQGDIYFRMKKYDDAANYYARAIEINDSIDKITYARQINELRTMYELDKLELEAEKTKLKLKNSRNLAALFSVLALVLAAFVLVVLNNQKKLKEKNRSLYHQISEQKKLLEKSVPETAASDTTGLVESVSIENNELMESLNALMRNKQAYTEAGITRKAVADMLNTNETYLFEAIKKCYSLTWSEYLNVLRLDHARDMLATPNCDLTIEAVAIDSGFGSRNTFYRLFRERFGLTPVEFRNLACEKKDNSTY
jgi:AraC-like DNA-binding protein/predicted negative regulator of RcsB-dependent stress response